MNKYAFLVFHKEYDVFVSCLQELGVVHITEIKRSQEEEHLKRLIEKQGQILHLKKELSSFLPKDPSDISNKELPIEIIINLSEDALSEYNTIKYDLHRLKETIQEQELWGEFDPKLIQTLNQEGLTLVGYVTSANVYTEEYQQAWGTISVARSGMSQYFVRLETSHDVPCPDAEPLTLPTVRLSEVLTMRDEMSQRLSEVEAHLRSLAPSLTYGLDAYSKILHDEYAFGTVQLQGIGHADNKIIFLEGWIPADEAKALEQKLEQKGYYYQNSEILREDRVPIRLKNNSFTRGFEVITRMFSLPNYSEIDQTVFFAPFFMLFFGLCMGDAGYGLIIFALATFLRLRNKKSTDKSMYSFMQWLGGSAFIVGMFTGSLFGVTLPYAKEKGYFLNQDNLMLLSVVLGLLQIFFAKFIAAYKTKIQRGTKYALAPFSWIVLLLSIGLMVGLPSLQVELPTYIHYGLYTLVGITGAIILFYNTPGANPFSNMGSALWTAYNTASGLLGDTLSYIRLFAIGLTGGILGSVFNTLAIDSTEGLNIALRLPLMLVILLAGHGINFAIAMIGALVHPIRLTFVEFYKNSEFEGGGLEYKPFKREVEKA